VYTVDRVTSPQQQRLGAYGASDDKVLVKIIHSAVTSGLEELRYTLQCSYCCGLLRCRKLKSEPLPIVADGATEFYSGGSFNSAQGLDPHPHRACKFDTIDDTIDEKLQGMAGLVTRYTYSK
jgi:hypothetical protein